METTTQINAKSKYDALKLAGYENIYWKGNKPYSVSWGVNTYNVYAIKISYNKYQIVIERCY